MTFSRVCPSSASLWYPTSPCHPWNFFRWLGTFREQMVKPVRPLGLWIRRIPMAVTFFALETLVKLFLTFFVLETPEGYPNLEGWKQTPTLRVLNLAYDVIPIEYVSVVVTEVGLVPPTSVPVILREAQQKLDDIQYNQPWYLEVEKGKHKI